MQGLKQRHHDRKCICAIDLETTGLDPREHRIVEFGAVNFSLEDGVIDTVSVLVNPGRSIPFPAIKVHGIKLGMVEDAPTPKEGWNTLLKWAGESKTFVAHSASFESGLFRISILKKKKDLLFLFTTRSNSLNDSSKMKIAISSNHSFLH